VAKVHHGLAVVVTCETHYIWFDLVRTKEKVGLHYCVFILIDNLRQD